jgi:hypothetical protein
VHYLAVGLVVVHHQDPQAVQVGEGSRGNSLRAFGLLLQGRVKKKVLPSQARSVPLSPPP